MKINRKLLLLNFLMIAGILANIHKGNCFKINSDELTERALNFARFFCSKNSIEQWERNKENFSYDNNKKSNMDEILNFFRSFCSEESRESWKQKKKRNTLTKNNCFFDKISEKDDKKLPNSLQTSAQGDHENNVIFSPVSNHRDSNTFSNSSSYTDLSKVLTLQQSLSCSLEDNKENQINPQSSSFKGLGLSERIEKLRNAEKLF